MSDKQTPSTPPRHRARPTSGQTGARRAQLVQVAHLWLQGHTQREIAARCRVDERTVRNRLNAIDWRELGVVDSFDLKAELNRQLTRFAGQESRAARMTAQAEGAGDFTAAARFMRLELQIQKDRLAYLERCGFYRHVAELLPGPGDPAADDAVTLRRLILGWGGPDDVEHGEASNDNPDR